MSGTQNSQPRQAKSAELREVLERAEQDMPGISELLKVYGGYEEMVLEVQRYVEATKPEPFVTTTNRSELSTQGV